MLNEKLHAYLSSRRFSDRCAADKFFERVFHWRKRLYFDEVENANVWSFYLVERDLHHAFEEWILARGLPPYAFWSRPEHDLAAAGLSRSTFPISETASVYRPPVPRAGQAIDYVLEVLCLEKNSALLGFLGYLIGSDNERSLTPSVASVWLRVFVQFEGDARIVSPIPHPLESALKKDLDLSIWEAAT